MRITIVTPWREHLELARDYWLAVNLVDADVLVIDDGSDPPLPNGYRISRVGFARACNTGLDLARTEAVLFLNNDIVSLGGDWLGPIMLQLDQGVLVGADLRDDPHGTVDGVAFPYLSGWCLAGLTEDLRDLGGWDESFHEPSYFGDNDLSLRARAAGMTLREARDVRARLHHKLNQTAGPGSDANVRAASAANYELFASRARDLLGVAA